LVIASSCGAGDLGRRRYQLADQARSHSSRLGTPRLGRLPKVESRTAAGSASRFHCSPVRTIDGAANAGATRAARSASIASRTSSARLAPSRRTQIHLTAQCTALKGALKTSDDVSGNIRASARCRHSWLPQAGARSRNPRSS